MEFIPGLDPTNQASGKLNIGFTGPKGQLCLQVMFGPSEFHQNILDCLMANFHINLQGTFSDSCAFYGLVLAYTHLMVLLWSQNPLTAVPLLLEALLLVNLFLLEYLVVLEAPGNISTQLPRTCINHSNEQKCVLCHCPLQSCLQMLVQL